MVELINLSVGHHLLKSDKGLGKRVDGCNTTVCLLMLWMDDGQETREGFSLRSSASNRVTGDNGQTN